MDLNSHNEASDKNYRISGNRNPDWYSQKLLLD